MVKILMFIPHLNMRDSFENAIKEIQYKDDITVELIHVFGTPQSLEENSDADIMVARGMTYDRLHKIFPNKHAIEIQLTSFDILDALIQCKEEYHPKRIALCLHNFEIKSLENLEKLCASKIDIYDVYDEESAHLAIKESKATDVFVGAGTVCGLCDRYGIPRIHIQTKDSAIEQALLEAIKTANTINQERANSNMFRTIINHNEDAIISINEYGIIQAINNQAYRTFQLSTLEDRQYTSIDNVCKNLKWIYVRDTKSSMEEIQSINGNNYYVQYRPIIVDEQNVGTVIITKNTEQIREAESKIRRSLAKKGLSAKYTFKDIIGTSEAIKENIKMAERYGTVDSNVLIIGETGTGKELFAHSIHNVSKRKDQPFVALNCAALPENLLESELFGYEEGAFSGAIKGGKMGLFELAHKGTIFLDEIGEVPITLQAKLLRVLQEKEIRRIGGNTVQPIDIRIISATNINIEEQIKEGKFRSDLYYRLNLLDIVIAPLRERKEDLQEMVDYYLLRFACEMGKPIATLEKKAAKLLMEYYWPGNVRELRNICERLTVLNDSDVITLADIKQLKIFKNLEVISEIRETKTNIEEGEIGIKPRKRKQDVADELGVSRTTLWRIMKQQKSNEKESS